MQGEARQELVVGNQLSEMVLVEKWLADIVRTWNLPEDVAFSVDLVVNEVVTNIMRYGYSDDGAHSITITLAHSDASIEIEIADDGSPFNPLSAPARNADEELSRASVGGWGIPLIKAFSAEQHYAYVSGTNRLRLVIASGRHS